MKRPKTQKRKKGQPTESWLPVFLWFGRKPVTPPKKDSSKKGSFGLLIVYIRIRGKTAVKQQSSRALPVRRNLLTFFSGKYYIALSRAPLRRYEMLVPIIGLLPYSSASIVFGWRRPPGRPKKAKAKIKRSFRQRLRLRPSVAFALIVGLIGVGYFSLMLARPTYSTPSFRPPTGNIQVPAKNEIKDSQPHLGRSVPVAVKVASGPVSINAPFIQVGRLADNTLQTPPDTVSVGWYKDSPTPGEIGPSVVVGHVDSYKSLGSFWPLQFMQPGMIIDITRQDGSVAKFKVDSVEQFLQADFPTDRVYGAIGYAGLRLITCGGEFDQQTHEYNKNTVVFASYIP